MKPPPPSRGTIQERPLTLAGAPALLVFQDDPVSAAAKGSVLFYHGLGVSKRAHLYEMGRLAQAGFLVAGVDAVGHGDRRYPDYEERFAPEHSSRSYWECVLQTVDEIPAIVDDLVDRDLSDGQRLGIAGISMGGYMAYGSVLVDKRIRAAAPVIASPSWRDTGRRSPHLHPEEFYPVALLSQTGGADTVVQPRHAREFHAALAPFYRDRPERLRYVEFAGACHFMPESDWERVLANMARWFERFLPGHET